MKDASFSTVSKFVKLLDCLHFASSPLDIMFAQTSRSGCCKQSVIWCMTVMQYDRRNNRVGFGAAPCQEIGTGELVLDPCDPSLIEEARSVAAWQPVEKRVCPENHERCMLTCHCFCAVLQVSCYNFALETPDMSCTYLAHHELQSDFIIVIVIIVWLDLATVHVVHLINCCVSMRLLSLVPAFILPCPAWTCPA